MAVARFGIFLLLAALLVNTVYLLPQYEIVSEEYTAPHLVENPEVSETDSSLNLSPALIDSLTAIITKNLADHLAGSLTSNLLNSLTSQLNGSISAALNGTLHDTLKDTLSTTITNIIDHSLNQTLVDALNNTITSSITDSLQNALNTTHLLNTTSTPTSNGTFSPPLITEPTDPPIFPATATLSNATSDYLVLNTTQTVTTDSLIFNSTVTGNPGYSIWFNETVGYNATGNVPTMLPTNQTLFDFNSTDFAYNQTTSTINTNKPTVATTTVDLGMINTTDQGLFNNITYPPKPSVQVQTTTTSAGWSVNSTDFGVDNQTASINPTINAVTSPIPVTSSIPMTSWNPMTSAVPTSGGPDFQRTVILIEKQTANGQNVFIQGGIDYSKRPGCHNGVPASQNPCAIPIRHLDMHLAEGTPARDAWATGDNYLDWEGPELNQGTFQGNPSRGTPAQWTSAFGKYNFELNNFGDHYWAVDVEMDCSRTEGGYFEFKSLVNGEWEGGAQVSGRCTGPEAGQPPVSPVNHVARCGRVNVFHWGTGQCQILGFPGAVIGSTSAPRPGDWKRTVIMVEKYTAEGQDVFLRGGIDYSHRPGCSASLPAASNPCAIPIRHLDLNLTQGTPKRDAWATGDNYLDWSGPEVSQGKYQNQPAVGTPAQWTDSDPFGRFYFQYNKYGGHYWTVDVEMDCSKTENGYFEFKSLVNGNWEGGAALTGTCTGPEAGQPPYVSGNHFGKCGFVNVFHWGTSNCEIYRFLQVTGAPGIVG